MTSSSGGKFDLEIQKNFKKSHLLAGAPKVIKIHYDYDS